MAIAGPSFIAKGDIYPCRFVKQDDSNDHAVLQAGANAKIIGVSQQGTREAPIPSVSTALAAAANESLRVHGMGEECLLELGGTVAAGDDLKADANGKGVVIANGTTTQEVGATALSSGVSGDKIRVMVALRGEGQTALLS